VAQQQLTDLAAQVSRADALLVGAYAVSRQDELIPELRFAKIRLAIVDASMLLTAVAEALRVRAGEERIAVYEEAAP